jgi:hypothetical protein
MVKVVKVRRYGPNYDYVAVDGVGNSVTTPLLHDPS